MPDMKGLAEKMLEGVKGYVEARLATLLARIEAVEQRPQPKPGEKGEKGERGSDGENAPAVDVAAIIDAVLARIPVPVAGRDGKDADPEVIKAMVEQAASLLPVAKDGRDGVDGKSIEADVVRSMVAAEVAKVPPAQPGRDGVDGKNADPEMTRELVAKAVAEMPVAKDGKDGRDGRDGEDGRDAAQIEVLDGIDPLKRYQRNTYVTHRGGFLRARRPTDLLPDGGDLEKAGWQVVARGVKDGAIEASEDMRTVGYALEFTDGVVVTQKMQLPVVIDRGIFKDGAYEQGDGTTWDGSFWIARRKTQLGEKPGDASGAWRLAVKRGRDGRDGLRGEKGDRGNDGMNRG